MAEHVCTVWPNNHVKQEVDQILGTYRTKNTSQFSMRLSDVISMQSAFL